MNDILEDDSTTGSPRALIDRPGPQGLVVTDWAAASVQGRQRLRNEDSWKQLGPVFVLADGMGGLRSGDQASSVAVTQVATEWVSAEGANPETVVRSANVQVRALSAGVEVDGSEVDDGEVDGVEPGVDAVGCTLSAVRIAHDQATVVHVGDSRVYRLRDGHAELLTRDHNLRSELLAAGIMPGNAKSLGPLRALTSYLGKTDHELQVDVRSVSLRAGDRLVLCTDGVFDEMSHGEFASRARTDSASAAATRLTSLRGSDDATAIVIDINVDQ